MAQETTQAEYQEIAFKKRARRRLVGAVALVLSLIVVLPMLLQDKHQDRPQQDLVITLPSEDSIPPSPVVESPATTTSNTSSDTNTGSDNSANSVNEAPVATATAPAASSAEKPAEKTPAGSLLQVGVFSDAANVKQLQSKLESNGFKVTVTTFENGKTRLRVGPFASKAEIDAATAKLQSLKFNPMVVND